MKVSQVCFVPLMFLVHADYAFFYSPEDFTIYLNYVCKLCFEEDSFSKALATVGENDNGMFDWLLLSNGYASFSNSAFSNVNRHLPQPGGGPGGAAQVNR